MTEWANQASRNDAVVLRGLVGSHFADDVLSWHSVNGQSAEDILPAVLDSTRNPHEFRDNNLPNSRSNASKHPMILVPLRDACKSSSDVAALIDRLFADIRDGKQLSQFLIAKELSRGKNGALSDAFILRTTISGVGVDLKQIFAWFRMRK